MPLNMYNKIVHFKYFYNFDDPIDLLYFHNFNIKPGLFPEEPEETWGTPLVGRDDAISINVTCMNTLDNLKGSILQIFIADFFKV